MKAAYAWLGGIKKIWALPVIDWLSIYDVNPEEEGGHSSKSDKSWEGGGEVTFFNQM